MKAASTNLEELRLIQGQAMVEQLEELQFHAAAKMLRLELKKATKQHQGSGLGPAHRRLMKKTSSLQDNSDDEDGDDTDDDETTESSTDSSDEASESEDASESASSDESSSEEEESSTSSSEDDDDDDSELSSTRQQQSQQRRRQFAHRSVSFSDDEDVVFVVSPKARRPKSLFYSKQDIDRFRLEDRMEKSQAAQAQLEELVSAAKSTMGVV